jgi:hypothetical protein
LKSLIHLLIVFISYLLNHCEYESYIAFKILIEVELADDTHHGKAASSHFFSAFFTNWNFLSLYPASLPIAEAAALTL